MRRNKLGKKLVASVLAVTLVTSLLTDSASIDAITTAVADERVTVIVQTEGASVLSAKGIADQGIETYRKTDKAKKLEKKALAVQRKVQKEMEQTVEDAEFGFSYTNVFNGFSVEINESDISKIKALDGVKAVYKSQTHSLEDPLPADTATSTSVETCCEMMGVDKLQEKGYTGEGEVVAVIDTELDVNHEMFSGAISDAKYSKNDIKNIINEENLNASVSVNQVYRSEKIPYAYNYSDGNADVYSADEDVWHGTHVAGIAVGNAGKTPDGETFIGVAPDAQLLFFGIPDFSDDSVFAALDDAGKMDVDVINCSWGADYYGLSDLYDEVMGNLKNAGVAVYVATGNAGEGNDAIDLLTTDVDDSSGGQPQDQASVYSVASADVTNGWNLNYKLTVGDKEVAYMLQGSKNFAETFGDNKPHEYVFCSYGEEQDFQNLDVQGKIALIRVENRDGVQLKCRDKAAFAIAAGAVGIIFICDDDNMQTYRILGVDEIPTILINQSDGEPLEQAAEKSFTTDGVKHSEKTVNTEGGISSYSSWATSSSLELKPDITAVGGSVYSSVAGDEYQVMSGTSMAAPHMTGIWALYEQFLKDRYGDTENTIDLGNYLLMSSATILYQDEEKTIPNSPRKQGAGLTNLEAATETPVYLEGTNGKCSISLKDQLTDTFQISFTAHNLSDQEVTYDSVSLYAMTDDYDEAEDGQYKKADRMKSLSYTCELPESVTVPAQGEKKITLTVKLDSKELEENMKIFSNGFFVDGYVVLDAKESAQPQISIPYSGFYGDWTQAQILDGEYYGEHRLNGNCLLTKAFGGFYIMGTNNYTPEGDASADSEDYAGISPNGDEQGDELDVCMNYLRDIRSITCDIKNEDGETISHVEERAEATCKYTDCVYTDDFSNSLIEEGKTPTEEGEYTATITVTLNYAREKTETVTMKFYVDTTAPEIGKVQTVQEDGKTYLEVQAADNKYLMGACVFDTETEGDDYYEDAAFEPAQKGTVKIDVTGQDLSKLTLNLYDYAANGAKAEVQDLLDNEKTPTATPTVSATTSQATSPSVSPAVSPAASPSALPQQDDNNSVIVKKLKFSPSTKKLKAGKSLKLKKYLKITKKKSGKVKISYRFAKKKYKKYATLTSSGVLKAKKKGKGKTITVCALAKDGSGKKAKMKIKLLK